MSGVDSSSNAIGDTSKSQLDDLFRTNQESVEKGIDTAFKTLNTSLYSIINSTFSSFSTDYEKRIDINRESHEKAVEALTADLKKSKQNLTNAKREKSTQQSLILANFSKIQALKKKSQILLRLRTYNHNRKETLSRQDTLLAYVAKKRKLKLFTAWRNICNSLIKGKIKLKHANYYNAKYQELTKDFNEELNHLKEVLKNLEIDIDKETEERRALNKLYDLSMKKGVEAFLKETNYIVDLNSSNVPTPHERSFEQNQLNQAS